MAHPYNSHREMKPGQKRAHEMIKHRADGGAVKLATGGSVKALKTGGSVKPEAKAAGGSVAPRLDKRERGGTIKLARGGKAKKGHHTHINIMVAPKGGDAAPPMGAGGPPMGGPPMGAPPMPPKAPMGPPPGGPMGAPGGIPGMPPGMPPKPPGVMARGGKAPSGISSKENLSHWANYAKSNTRYEQGGKVPMKAGAITGQGRKEKIKAYGKNARKG